METRLTAYSKATNNRLSRQFSHPPPTNDRIAEQNNPIRPPNGKTGGKAVVLGHPLGVGLLFGKRLSDGGRFVSN